MRVVRHLRGLLGGQLPALLRGQLRGQLISRNPALGKILAAGFLSGLGDRLHQVALAALVLALTDSLAHAGLVFVAAAVPYALFGLVAGALVDRWNRRRAMVGADLARAVLVAVIPLAAALNLAWLYALIFAITCARMVFQPAQQAAVPDLVEKEDLLAANSLAKTVQYVTDLLGYPVAAGLVTLMVGTLGPIQGTQLAFALDAGSFLLSAALLCRLPDVSRPGDGAPLAALWVQVKEGLRFLSGHAQVRANTVLLTLGPLLLGSLHTLWVGFAWRVSHTDAIGFGVTETLMGAGTLAGLWLLQRLVKQLNKGRVILLGFLLTGGSVLAVGFTDSLAVAAGLAALCGAGNMLFLVPSVTLVQQETPSPLRGRVLGARLTLTYAAFSLSNALTGSLSDLWGVSTLMVLLGGGTLAMAGGAYLFGSAREA